MLVNFLPSLEGMEDNELFTNIMALGILISTTILNLYIDQETTYRNLHAFLEINVLEAKYQKLHKLESDLKKKKLSVKELTCRVKRYWIMVETGDPRFVLACSPFSFASRLIYVIFAAFLFRLFVAMSVFPHFFGMSIDTWSLIIIYTVQFFGIVICSIAPIFRCFTTATYFNPTIGWSIKRINMFRVKKHWTQRLQQWKDIYIVSYRFSLVTKGFSTELVQWL
ncbi:LOW QUALITY PROTEIN: hypothetical protein OSB04_013462 [Centaurea solstitialis]|uniref:Uncharacterized protein n=1 Tax=Centaurea solstitialis TaxID=347529 RepID=A0AA38TY21_9ASTR|nr:LOW QUALITY PROTEIN: hypothetical protein OSB04_013462 [Centaurea solstitialis]